MTHRRSDANPVAMKQAFLLLAAAAPVLLAGCVQIQAPDKPIEINLNVNIKQEVVLTLKKDAEDLVNNNPELFPQ